MRGRTKLDLRVLLARKVVTEGGGALGADDAWRDGQMDTEWLDERWMRGRLVARGWRSCDDGKMDNRWWTVDKRVGVGWADL
ncbi:hypothetical protein Cadr_000025028 [Camelus dromedarius]|uniref:Uncharacterized protein n=1 Tax=Camelus dromedarius TaxID=9838 RepID=A0A5N4CKC9_CAMDR|nr:hypothetical protein Cadr_000025028 [Camelus dromedarius]